MSEPPRLRAAVFDLDGLMFNTEDLNDDDSEILLQRRGHQYTEELKFQMLGRPAQVGLKMMIDAHRLDATVGQLQAESGSPTAWRTSGFISPWACRLRFDY